MYTLDVTSKETYELITYKQKNFEVSLSTLGAGIEEIYTLSNKGKLENIVLSPSYFPTRENGRSFLGKAIGPLAGRVPNSFINCQNNLFYLDKNEGSTSLHGGFHGFDTIIWSYQVVESTGKCSIHFTHTFPDGLGGYPGNRDVSIHYHIYPNQTIRIEYVASSDQFSLMNPTNHTYFNLSGNLVEGIETHQLKVSSSFVSFLESDQTINIMPTSIKNTDFDFRKSKSLATILNSKHPQIKQEKGLNHPFLLDAPEKQVILSHPKSGRKLKVTTTNKAVVLYTGNHFYEDQLFPFHPGIALETQHILTESDYTSCIIEPDKPFYSKTEWEFF